MRGEGVPEGLAGRDLLDFGDPPRVDPKPPSERRVSIGSTAGLIHRGDRSFGLGSADDRVIDRDDERDLLMTHPSTNFDRSGSAQDHEVVLPLQRLREAADDGLIGA